MWKVDTEIVQKISNALKVSTLRRTDIVNTVHDFSKKYIPENIIESLKLVSNYVVHTTMNESDARLKMEGELLAYLVKYRRYIENKEIPKDNLNEQTQRVVLLEKALFQTQIQKKKSYFRVS